MLRRIVKDAEDTRAWAVSAGLPHDIPEFTGTFPYVIKVAVRGPKDTPYERGTFIVACNISKDFPRKSPTMVFLTKIWHPNINYESGSVCASILKGQSPDNVHGWNPLVRVADLFQLYIPTLMSQPEPMDPFNADAASEMLEDPAAFDDRARDETERHATV